MPMALERRPSIKSLFLLCKQPGQQSRLFYNFRPDEVPFSRILCISCLSTRFSYCRHNVSRAFDVHGFILLTMKNPDRCADKTRGFGFVSTSAKSNTSSKHRRVFRNDRKGAKASHRLARDIQPAVVNAIRPPQITDQLEHQTQLPGRGDRIVVDPT